MSDEVKRVVFLRGKKTVLRPTEETDLPRLQRWINDPDVIRGTLQFLPMSMTSEQEWLERIRKRTDGFLLAIETLEGRHIGSIGIFNISWRDGTASTGTLIGEKEFWGKGYATDAKMQLLNYAFNTLNLRKMCTAALEFNEASWRYNMKCGYHIEGHRKRQFYRDGLYWDEIMLAVFREEWLPLWEKYLQDSA